ncbi:YggT family protein [Marinobacter sp. 1Y8]
MLAQILTKALLIISTFYLTIVLLRFLLQLARADFYNPICQFAVKATNPLLRPLRKIIPGWGGIDGAALVLALLVQTAVFLLILAAKSGGLPIINPVTLLAWSVVTVLGLIIKIYFWSVLAVVLISWIAPSSTHPAIQLVSQLTEPVMRPIRNAMPPIGGLDLSPMVVIFILYMLTAVVGQMAMSVGLGSIGTGM